jgi:hypothetical protein
MEQRIRNTETAENSSQIIMEIRLQCNRSVKITLLNLLARAYVQTKICVMLKQTTVRIVMTELEVGKT